MEATLLNANGPVPVGHPWRSVVAFMRIATNPRASKRPLAIEHGLTVCSADTDFARFAGSVARSGRAVA